MSARLHVKQWAEFQHYKDRNPAWIKLHKRLLDDFEFHRLPIASRALAPMIWLLASETQDGAIEYEPARIAFRLHMREDELTDAIEPLINGGFLRMDQDASKPLAEPERTASPERERETEEETETETETETEKRQKESAACASPSRSLTDPLPAFLDHRAHARAVEMWNEVAERHGLPQCQKLSDTRRSKLRDRLQDAGGLDGWQAALDRVDQIPGLRGDNERGWKADIDFLLQDKTFTKLMEGSYDGWNGKGGRDNGLDAFMRAAAGVAAGSS